MEGIGKLERLLADFILDNPALKSQWRCDGTPQQSATARYSSLKLTTPVSQPAGCQKEEHEIKSFRKE